MESGLKEREGDPVSQELDRAKKTIGELTMEVELLRKRCEAHRLALHRKSVRGRAGMIRMGRTAILLLP